MKTREFTVRAVEPILRTDLGAIGVAEHGFAGAVVAPSVSRQTRTMLRVMVPGAQGGRTALVLDAARTPVQPGDRAAVLYAVGARGRAAMVGFRNLSTGSGLVLARGLFWSAGLHLRLRPSVPVWLLRLAVAALLAWPLAGLLGGPATRLAEVVLLLVLYGVVLGAAMTVISAMRRVRLRRRALEVFLAGRPD